jgi:hypothetical protein
VLFGAIDHPGVIPHLDRSVTDPRYELVCARARDTVLGGLEQFDADHFPILAHETTTVPRHGLLPFQPPGIADPPPRYRATSRVTTLAGKTPEASAGPCRKTDVVVISESRLSWYALIAI